MGRLQGKRALVEHFRASVFSNAFLMIAAHLFPQFWPKRASRMLHWGSGLED